MKTIVVLLFAFTVLGATGAFAQSNLDKRAAQRCYAAGLRGNEYVMCQLQLAETMRQGRKLAYRDRRSRNLQWQRNYRRSWGW
jgi:hypothetical protein